VVASLEGDDLILCQITSQPLWDSYSIELHQEDFESGTLRQDSNGRPNRLFTADRRIVLYRTGHLKPAKTEQVVARISVILAK